MTREERTYREAAEHDGSMCCAIKLAQIERRRERRHEKSMQSAKYLLGLTFFSAILVLGLIGVASV